MILHSLTMLRKHRLEISQTTARSNDTQSLGIEEIKYRVPEGTAAHIRYKHKTTRKLTVQSILDV